MTSLLLVAALAASPDSLPPPASPSVVRDTVYIERVITERPLNPQAAPPETVLRKEGKAAQIVVGALLVGAGAYLAAHGSENPDYEFDDGRLEKRTNKDVYIGIGIGLVGLIAMVL